MVIQVVLVIYYQYLLQHLDLQLLKDLKLLEILVHTLIIIVVYQWWLIIVNQKTKHYKMLFLIIWIMKYIHHIPSHLIIMVWYIIFLEDILLISKIVKIYYNIIEPVITQNLMHLDLHTYALLTLIYKIV